MLKTVGILLLAAGVVLIAAGIAVFFISDAKEAAKALVGTGKYNRGMPETEDIARKIYYSDAKAEKNIKYRGNAETEKLRQSGTEPLVIEPGSGTRILDLNRKSCGQHDTELLR